MRTASGGQTIVTIQPQATPQQQSIQVRGPTIATVLPTSTLQRPAGQTSNVIGQPSTTVGQPNVTTFAATGEMSK